jgi:hypothetical protein
MKIDIGCSVVNFEKSLENLGQNSSSYLVFLNKSVTSFFFFVERTST